jgi:hypothetical protein
MWEEYEIQTTVDGRDINLHRLYDKIEEDIEISREEMDGDSLKVRYIRAKYENLYR